MTWTTKLIKAIALSSPFVIVATLTATPAARADQCWAVTEKQADVAAEILNVRHETRIFCAPCRDKVAVRLSAARAVRARRGEHHVVAATDAEGKVHELDLAYTYVRMKAGSNEFVNMASLVGCPASNVPKRIDGSGKSLD